MKNVLEKDMIAKNELANKLANENLRLNAVENVDNVNIDRYGTNEVKNKKQITWIPFPCKLVWLAICIGLSGWKKLLYAGVPRMFVINTTNNNELPITTEQIGR